MRLTLENWIYAEARSGWTVGREVAIREALASLFRFSCRREIGALKTAEYISEDEMTLLQQSRLKKLLLHAFANVPYYRKQLTESGVVRDRTRVSLDDFGRLPLLTKETMRGELPQMVSSDLSKRRHYYETSGGSTGEPVTFVQDEEYRRWVRAGKILFDEWTGYKPGKPKVVLWGSERDLLVGRESLGVLLRRWLKNERWQNAFRMTEGQMRNYIDQINADRPAQILAYVESIYELARFAKRNDLSVQRPNAVMTSAGTLSPDMRQCIEQVLGCSVFNRYGSREVGDIACECESHQGLHVSPLTHYVEILRPDGTPALPGEIGEVVLTSLVNYAMPIIRYRIGDMAAWASQKCTCGRHWPLLAKVVGRVSDTFTTMRGTRVHGEYFTHLMYFREWVQRFQFIQEDYDHIRLLVVPTTEVGNAQKLLDKERAEIERKIRVVMGNDCRLTVELVDEIHPSPSGKYRYTISRV